MQSLALKQMNAAVAARHIGPRLGQNDVDIAVDARTNSFVVRGDAKSLAAVKRLIAELDGEPSR